MISISLLPPEYRQISILRQKQRRLILGFTIFSLVLLVVVGFLSINTRIAQSQLDSTMAYRQVLENQLQALAVYEEPFEQLTHLKGIKQEITAGQVDWSQLLSELGKRMPQGVWLTDFHGTVADPGEKGASNGDLTLRGGAVDHLLVGQFLEELGSLPTLSDVKCNFSNVTGSGHTQFEITGSVMALIQDHR